MLNIGIQLVLQQISQLRQVECFLLPVLQYLKFKHVAKIILILSNLSEGLPELLFPLLLSLSLFFLLLERLRFTFMAYGKRHDQLRISQYKK